MTLLDPRRPATLLAFCSGWCSLQMLFWPEQFVTAHAMVTASVGLHGHERSWAVFGLLSTIMKVAALAGSRCPRWAAFAEGLLAAALFLAIVFWLIVGLSILADDPYRIMPVALTGFAVAAAWQLAGWHKSPEHQG
jgi:hypothetical protein